MGSKKKQSTSGKRSGRRVGARHVAEKKQAQAEQKASQEPESKPRITERIQEKDAGFGVLKWILGTLIVLILVAGALSRIIGEEQDSRGDKLPGEQCDLTEECRAGSICAAHQSEERRCLTRCQPDANECDPGYTCTSITTRKTRKGVRVKTVCIKDATAP
jgi:hypothetical protein